MVSDGLPRPADHLAWQSTTVRGRPALYGVAGEGIPLLFLHGWGLAHHAYKRPLKRLVHLGCRVYAPALPGFGGTGGLPKADLNLAGYAAWVDEYLDAVGATEPLIVVGHSFGGGVAIQVAHDLPRRVRSLVLVNSIGGSVWSGTGSTVRKLAERPLWDWGIHFPSDLLPVPQITKVLPVVLEDAVPNLIRNPAAMWRVAQVARTADLTAELEDLKRRRLPVVVLWGEKDRIIPKESFDALCQAIGSEGAVVTGNHSWLLADPDAFGEVMTNVVSVARVARSMEGRAKRRRGLFGLSRGRPRMLRTLRGAKPADEADEAVEDEAG
ncbi:MAG: alpha/beta fold hydrolase [Acidimicrobiia bacterium]|nr:alpha/beta fold hydrolase [Acidimicrobiia bacterium]